MFFGVVLQRGAGCEMSRQTSFGGSQLECSGPKVGWRRRRVVDRIIHKYHSFRIDW